VPTMREQGLNMTVGSWQGLFVPQKTPKPVVDKLNQAIVKIFVTPDAQARLAAVGADAQTNTPDQFAQSIARERAKWAKIVKESGARAD